MNKRHNPSTASKPGSKPPQKRHKSSHARDRPRFKLNLTENWILVFLRSGKHFFFNKETKESVWEAPENVDDYLYSHVDQNLVLVLLARARGLRKKDDVYWRVGEDTLHDRVIKHDSAVDESATGRSRDADSAKAGPKSTDSVPTNDASNTAPVSTETAATADSELTKPNTQLTEHPADSANDDSDEYSSSDESEGENNGIDFAALLSDDENDDKEESEVSRDSILRFKELLGSRDVNPFSTWDKELSKVVDDDRYELLETRLERENAFNEWSRDVIKLKKAEKSDSAADEELEVTISPQEEFVMLLKDTFKKGKFYVEWRRKNKDDLRFKDVDLSDKEREAVYRQYSKSHVLKNSARKSAFLDLLDTNKALITPSTNLGNLSSSVSLDIRCMVLDIEDRAEILDDFVSKLVSGEVQSVAEEKRKKQERLLYEKSVAAQIMRREAEWGITKQKKRLEKRGRDEEREVKKLGREGLKSQLEK